MQPVTLTCLYTGAMLLGAGIALLALALALALLDQL